MNMKPRPRPRASWAELFNMAFIILIALVLALASLGVQPAEDILCPRSAG